MTEPHKNDSTPILKPTEAVNSKVMIGQQEDVFQRLFKIIADNQEKTMENQKKTMETIEQGQEDIRRGLKASEDLKREITERIDRFEVQMNMMQRQNQECVNRWQELDTRLSITEERVGTQNHNIRKQEEVNRIVSDRLDQLELKTKADENKNPNLDMSNKPINASSTVVGFAQSSAYQPGTQPTTLGASVMGHSLFSSQERLVDAVAEFTGYAQSIHP